MSSLFFKKAVFQLCWLLMVGSVAFGLQTLVLGQTHLNLETGQRSSVLETKLGKTLIEISRLVEIDQNLQVAYESWQRLKASQKEKEILAESSLDLSFLSRIAHWLKEEGETAAAIEILSLKLNTEGLREPSRSLDHAREFQTLRDWNLEMNQPIDARSMFEEALRFFKGISGGRTKMFLRCCNNSI